MEFVNPSGIPGNAQGNLTQYVIEILQNLNKSQFCFHFFIILQIYAGFDPQR
jgi:hypothetical protein